VLGSKSLRQHAGGFTLVELIVVVSVFGVISVAFIGMVTSYFVVINRNNKLTEMTVDSQNLLRTTVENIRFGDGVRQTNEIVDPKNPGGWSTSNTNFVIVIPVPAVDSSRQYIIDPLTGSPYMNELVYYKDGTTLRVRKLAHPDATGNNLRTTCPPNNTEPGCTADPRLADYVNSMLFTLYDQNAAITANAADARSVKIALTMQRNAPGNPINLSTDIRVTLRNRF
jgi:prepilin-type N-terminal cleavage/methylation domain-containing protein